MTLRSTLLTGAIIALIVPSLTGASAAGPLAGTAVLKDAAASPVESVQYRHRRSGRWIGPAAGFAAGAVIGGIVAPRYYDPGYGAYAYDPGYAYAPALVRRYRSNPSNCGGDAEWSSSFPSWMCRTDPPY
jgi:hypothetical protein